MKQMKFILVALMAVVMGITVTSCMKGDDNTIYTGPAFAKCISFFPPTFQLDNGQKLVVQDASLSTVNEGEIYFFYYQFDTALQDASSSSLNVTLYGGSTPTSISAKSQEGPMGASEMTKANAPLYVLSGYVDRVAIQPAVGFSNSTLIVPVVYWVKAESTEEKQKEELNKHSFILTYDTEKIKSGDTKLTLTLNHVINDGEVTEPIVRNNYTSTYKAYNLSGAMYAFEAKAGNKPTTITVEAQTNSSKNSLEDARLQSWDYTIKK